MTKKIILGISILAIPILISCKELKDSLWANKSPKMTCQFMEVEPPKGSLGESFKKGGTFKGLLKEAYQRCVTHDAICYVAGNALSCIPK